MEDYLLDAGAIAGEFDVDEDFVAAAMTDVRPGKEGLNAIIEAVSKKKGLTKSESVDATLKGRIASRVTPHGDLVSILDKLRGALD